MNNLGISVITCTNRQKFIDNIFENYLRQSFNNKELIIILNNDNIDTSLYKNKCKEYTNIRVYKINQVYNLGYCLNYGIKKAKKDIIAKFDDDDYYGENYLEECIEAFNVTRADIVGKYTFFIYFENEKGLALRKNNKENSYVNNVAGATLSFKKNVFKKVKFSTSLRSGVDTDFRKRALKNGFKIYSTSKHNFVAHRRGNFKDHTWKIKDEELFKAFPIIEYTDDYSIIVNQI